MPNPEMTEYLTACSESGKDRPEDWCEDKGDEFFRLIEQVNVGKERCREKAPFDFIQPTVQGEKLKRLWDALAEIESECKMPGWDGYGAAPLSSDALAEIKVLLELLPPYMPAPDIVPEQMGAIGLEWRRGKDAILVLSVQGKGVISYAAILGAETKRYGMERFAATVPRYIQRELFPHFFETS